MPRKRSTKMSQTQKKNAEKLEELELMHKAFIENSDLEYENSILAISDAIAMCKSKTPSRILKMTMGELKELSGSTFNEVTEQIIRQENNDENSKDSNLNLKEDEEIRNARSRSASNNRRLKIVTSVCASGGARVSRKDRKQPQFQIYRSASVEVIRPKMQSSTPGSIVRHARKNEVVYSLKGSPVVTNKTVEKTTSISIPTKTGVLAMRPEKWTNNDRLEALKLDGKTLKQLTTLHDNLRNLIEMGNKK